MPIGRHRWQSAAFEYPPGARFGVPAAEVVPPGDPRALRVVPVAVAELAYGRLLFESAHDAVLVATRGGDVLDANAAACAMFGGDVDTLCALGRDGLADVDDPRFGPFLAERRATGSARAKLRLHRVGGATFEADLLSQEFETPDGERLLLLVVRELTELLRLEGLQDGYRSLFEKAYDGIAVFALDGTIADINAAGAALLGRPRGELIGSHFASYVPPEAVRDLEALLAARVDGDGDGRCYEVELVAADGARFPVEITSAALVEAGRMAGLTCVIRDLRDRIAAQREQAELEAQLRHAEKLKSLGVLAGGIAHDFNNLLLAVLGHASIARAELAPDASVQESLAAIEVGARRCADLANQVLAYAGRSEAALRSVDANEQARELDYLLRASIPRRIDLRFDLGDDLPPVLADPVQLRQLLLNVITNAADAIGDGNGVVTLTTRRRAVVTGTAVGVLGEPIAPGEYVELRIDDTGEGMDVETQRRIFDPFFTTKRTGHGLGLAAAAGIIRSHRGDIELESTPGAGSSFRILLPAAPPVERVEPGTPDVAETGDGVVLVVDDDEQVRSVAGRMLEYFGYSIVAAGSADEAVAVAADGALDAALLDVNLAGRSGAEALLELRQSRPGLPVLLMSGTGREEAPVPDDVEFIQKPFSADELVRRLQAAIARTGAR